MDIWFKSSCNGENELNIKDEWMVGADLPWKSTANSLGPFNLLNFKKYHRSLGFLDIRKWNRKVSEGV